MILEFGKIGFKFMEKILYYGFYLLEVNLEKMVLIMELILNKMMMRH